MAPRRRLAEGGEGRVKKGKRRGRKLKTASTFNQTSPPKKREKEGCHKEGVFTKSSATQRGGGGGGKRARGENYLGNWVRGPGCVLWDA